MKLYLDDLRESPDGFVIVRDYEECILLLEQCDVSTLSLDHDLGEEKTGYDVAKWIVEHGRWPSSIYLHTSNPVGRDNMYQLLMHYKPKHVSVYPFRPV
ncbi:cyclic-phosphate processing receiver domain-containing protein [Alicyclobacillus sp. SO9]|uniref:cyclic-phosphate processing receiver domain-containing protein n=1 Tax=Alicyclobacillus sp. SO9 TaxID=2665646 RepID=UPI0018E734E3|nr:cyclic-phosphate processing receiver domain-containing protein [Alicyclobacillus sp. SO9]QQE81192.1 cell division protein FtsJ [Alicyclobacillus sp. SO9]